MPETIADLLQNIKKIAGERPELKDRLSQIYLYVRDQIKSGANEKEEVSFANDDIAELLTLKSAPSSQYRPSRQPHQLKGKGIPSYLMKEDKTISLLRSIKEAVKKLQK